MYKERKGDNITGISSRTMKKSPSSVLNNVWEKSWFDAVELLPHGLAPQKLEQLLVIIAHLSGLL